LLHASAKTIAGYSSFNDLIENEIECYSINTFGIWLYLTSVNNEILFNNIKTTGDNGYCIHLEQSPSNDIINNTLNTTGDNGKGIFVELSNNVNIINNTIDTSGIMVNTLINKFLS